MPQMLRDEIGDWDLSLLRDQAKQALFERFLPHMESYVIDHEYGGFMCDVEIDTCKLRSTTKTAWFEGRGIWAYSFLYNHFDPNPHYLEIARKSIAFVLPHQPAGDGFWPESFTREGRPASGPGDIYGNLFIAEGLAEFSKATGERQYFILAKQLVLSALSRYDRSDYRYTIRFGLTNVPEVPAPRVLGHWMIFLHLATQLLEQEFDRDIAQIADRSIEAIMKHHLNGEFQLMNECLDHDLGTPADEWGQFVCLGHACETLWMVMSEALRRGDPILFREAAAAFKRHAEVATDPVGGGYFTTLENVSRYSFQTDKSLWCQEEVLNGALLLIEHTGDKWAHDCFVRTYNYIQERFAHPEFAFVVENGDRNMAHYLKTRAEHYHHPRRLMISIQALERMMRKKEGREAGEQIAHDKTE